MPITDFYQPFAFDADSAAGPQNFLRLLQNPNTYTVTQSTPTLFVVTLITPSGAIARIEFAVDPDSTFAGVGIPTGVVDAVNVYDAAGQPVASFAGMGAHGLSIADLINQPALLVAGHDDFLGSDGDDLIDLGTGDDLGGGGAGDDVIHGGDGNDYLYDDAVFGDQDKLNGGAGFDFLAGTAGDILDGGEDIDVAVVVFAGAGAGITWDLSAYTPGTILSVPGGGSLISIEAIGLVGTSFADTFALGAWNGLIYGMDGDDVLTGGAGGDLIYGGEDDDTIHADGDAGDVDELYGEAGDDIIYASGGDRYDGGEGHDRLIVDFAGWSGPASLGNGMSPGMTSYAGFEYLEFSGAEFMDSFAVYLPGIYDGRGNNDHFGINGSNATARGGEGNDVFALFGGANVVMEGGGGDDQLELSAGTQAGAAVSFDGGTGTDFLIIANDMSAGAYTIDLRTGSAVIFNVSLTSIERLHLWGTTGADTVYGGIGSDTILSGGGADSIYGGDGDDFITDNDGDFGSGLYAADIINGGAGNDTLTILATAGDVIDGGDGDDTAIISVYDPVLALPVYDFRLGPPPGITVLNVETVRYALSNGLERITVIGTDFADRLSTGAGDDIMSGGGGNDDLMGDWGDDILRGDAGDDLLNGYDGADTLHGGDGDDILMGDGFGVGAAEDVLEGGQGNDRLEGGGGASNTASYSEDIAGVMVNLATGFAQDGWGTRDTLIAIGHLAGSAFADSLTGNFEDNRLAGNAGDDTLFGSGGNDVLLGGLGDDLLDGGAGMDAASYAGSTTAVAISLAITTAQAAGAEGFDTFVGIENLIGSAFNDSLTGNALANTLDGGDGDDTLTGGAGDDILVGGAGYNVLSGGEGMDVMSLELAPQPVWVDMRAGVYSSGAIWNVFDASTEGAMGSWFDDTLIGNDGDNFFLGNVGNDIILGGAGDDYLRGEGGDDWLDGGAGDDVLEGAASGVNVLIGGEGLDIVSYETGFFTNIRDLWIDMTAGVYHDILSWDVFDASIEGVRGANANDTIFGNAGDNWLDGNGGNDALIGGLGNDRLIGGLGNDWLVGGEGDDWIMGGAGVDVLTGGAGADTFDLGTNAGWDVAFDFNTAQDRFSLGGHTWSGFFTIDADGDGQTDDTLLGYAGGNFVALNVSGLTLDQWNALIVAPAGADDGDALAAKDEDLLAAVAGGDGGMEPAWDNTPADVRELEPYLLAIEPDGPYGWSLFG